MIADAPLTRQGSSTLARLAFPCPACDLPVYVGQVVQLWSDGRYRHYECNCGVDR